MTLDLLVPHYNETTEEVSHLLDSLATQQNVDFNDIKVIIANDGPDCAKLKFREYPFEVKIVDAPKGGVSATRNFALKHSAADYVMFCDADDMFYSNVGIFLILQEVSKSKFDYMMSTFIEETRNPMTNEVIYVPHEFDQTFVHGKVIRRDFLKKNKIKWNPKLTIHEDSYFNILCIRMAKEAKHCPVPFYLWKWRDASVCRHDPKYILKTYNNMLESSTALIKQFIERNRLKDAAEIAVQMIIDSYLTMNKREWLDQENKEYRDNTEKRFAKYWTDFKDLWDGTPENVRDSIIVAVKNRMFQEGVILEKITFDDWIKHIQSL